jgi:hypothetical protein
VARIFRLIWETYTPAEAAIVTEVTVNLQRDWRWRKIEKPLAKGEKGTKHPRWEAGDLARLFVRGQLSRAGISVKHMTDIAALAEWPIREKIADICLKGNPAYSPSTEKLARFIIWTPAGVVRSETAEASASQKPLIQIAIDCHEAARLIVDRAPRLPVRVEVGG